ncbi:MAG: type II/IV secretion system protein [Pseudomonadota bacterium]|nr:type II/IV secretion system protein [Pseudomonadota bacterium]
MNSPIPAQRAPGAAVPPQSISQARSDARAARRPVVEVLDEQLGLAPQVLNDALADLFHYRTIAMGELRGAEPDFTVMPFTEALERRCIPVRDPQSRLLLVFGDPFDAALQAWADATMPETFEWRLAHHRDVAAFLARQEETLHAMEGALQQTRAEGGADSKVDDLSLKTISEDTSPIVKLVNSTLYDALKAAASDIHLETNAGGMSIKYRVDGVLSMMGTLSGSDQAEQVISRLKVMSELDIAERRVPQDGRFQVSIRGRKIDFRVSIMPSIHGEDAVLRILDKQSLSDEMKGLRLDTLGLADEAIQRLRRLASEPYGMVLVTGPTGSGKTTTLYAAISEINHGQDKIITIEDPVEYQLPGVLQIPVNEKKGLTFARGLRSILRHDPDKIMVGEIRDAETAQIAIQSALTGHLVFTTVHANNVFDVLGRFLHMGVDPYSFVSALNGILAQRLVRRICPDCSAPDTPEASALADAGIPPEEAASYRFCLGRGCGQCRGTGYRGRRAIAEILTLTDEIRELIIARAPVRQVKEAARRNGTRLLREAALELVRCGETSLQEANRVTFVS